MMRLTGVEELPGMLHYSNPKRATLTPENV